MNTPLKTLEMSFMDQYYQAKERQASYERNAVDKNGAFLVEITLNSVRDPSASTAFF